MNDQVTIDAIGFAAAGLVLVTFCMRTMGALRWVAIASNFIFIAYGYLGNLPPVLLLHALLLPVNAYRLTQFCSAGGILRQRAEQEGGRPPQVRSRQKSTPLSARRLRLQP